MEYELYIDIFFLVNFMMDYIVLLTVRRMLKCTATHGHILLGALAGASGSCIVICVPIPQVLKIICLHTVINASMVILGLQIRKIHIFLQATILVYMTTFFMGGIMTWLRQYFSNDFRIGSLFFFVVACSYTLTNRAADFLEKLWETRIKRCEVTLYWKGRTIRTQAMVDSGNSLSDPLTGKPVHIIGKKAMKKLTEDEEIEKLRYITYCTIQEQESVMPVIMIDKMCIHGSEEKQINFPLFGISGQEMFGNENYEIILHPRDC